MRINIFGGLLSGALSIMTKRKAIIQTLAGTLTMGANYPNKLILDPGGAGRTILLPAEADGLWYDITNTADAAETLTVKEDSNTTTIATIEPGQTTTFFCQGGSWYAYQASAGVGGVVAANGDTLTVTKALHAGKIVQFGKTTGTIVTLPAALGFGDIYRFVIGVTATSNANIIKVANATDVMDGSLNIQQDTDADGTTKVWRADAGDDTMTFAGAATTGGIVGGYIECRDYKAGFWSCTAFTQSGGGAEATPFSATVS
jgi:hypothetical protein